MKSIARVVRIGEGRLFSGDLSVELKDTNIRPKSDYVVVYTLDQKGDLSVRGPGKGFIGTNVAKPRFSIPTCFLPKSWRGKRARRVVYSLREAKP